MAVLKEQPDFDLAIGCVILRYFRLWKQLRTSDANLHIKDEKHRPSAGSEAFLQLTRLDLDRAGLHCKTEDG